MRIQNNITAMNTHRMYTINNDNVAKSAEKLSSGYRINRAGDDAAGLAISEKMRAQIRGLNMATKNSQDAISLVQTAEGALQETQNMLQRMNELAVQAATGTNEDLDRTALSKEFEQLKREINDIAEQTNFNNMKILDGSMSYEGFVRSAATAGVTMTVESDGSVSPAGIKVNTQAGTAGATGVKSEGGLALATTKLTDADAAFDYKLNFKVNGQDVTLKDANGNDLQYVTGSKDAAISDLINGAKFSVDGKSYTISAINATGHDGKIKITADEPGQDDLHNMMFEVGADKVVAGSHEPVAGGANFFAPTSGKLVKPDATAGSPTKGVDQISTQPAVTTLELDPSKMKDGDQLTIAGKTYTFYSKGAVDANGNQLTTNITASGGTVVWNGKTDEGSDLAKQLENALKDADNGNTNTIEATAAAGTPGVSVARSGNTITIQGTYLADTTGATAYDKYTNDVKNAEAATDQVRAEFKSAAGGSASGTKTTVEFDIAKMKDGDEFTIKADNKSITVKFSDKDDRASFMKKVSDAAKQSGIGEVKGNALLVEEKEVSVELKDSWTKNVPETNAIRIQVGANEHEMLSVSIDSMNTAGLKLDDQFLTKVGNSVSENQDLAGKAITATRNAINKVSDQRATLGAMQNRLDHKIANLKVSSENLSAAESRIRDVDMASEMTNFTKNNILSQAATAMLAQANSLPQNVLSLLG